MLRKNPLMVAVIGCLIMLNSCSEDINEQNEVTQSVSDQLKAHLTEFEIIELNPQELLNKLKAGPDAVKELVLKPKTLEFQVEAPSHSSTFLVGNEDGSKVSPMAINSRNLNYFESSNIDDENVIGISFEDNSLYAEVYRGEEMYVLTAAKDFVEGADANIFVLFRPENMIELPGAESICTVENSNSISAYSNEDTSNLSSRAKTYKVLINIFADYTFFNYLGSDAAYNYMSKGIKMANLRYKKAKNLPVTITESTAIAQSYDGQYGIYNNSDDEVFLSNFANGLINNGWLNHINLCFSLNRGHWGAAEKKSICTIEAVGYVEYHPNPVRRYNIIAHEIGHMLGSEHTEKGIMKPRTGFATFFDAESKQQMRAHLSKYASCVN